MRRILSLDLLLSALLLAGCATRERSESLTTTLGAYGSALRWSGFQSAAQFIDPKIRAAHPLTQLDIERYRQVRVSEYDDGAGPVPVDDDDVQQTARISVINVHTQVERSIIDHQTWHYDQKNHHWWLTSGLPRLDQH